MCLPVIFRQRVGKNVTAATNTQATIESFLDASYSMPSVSYQRKAGHQFFPGFLIFMIEYVIELTLTRNPAGRNKINNISGVLSPEETSLFTISSTMC
jgi:hypothetical protein